MSGPQRFPDQPNRERRRFGRRTTFKSARILAEGLLPLDCMLVDISDGGAGLRISDDPSLPPTFELFIEADDIIVLCRVAYRTAGKVGVEFLRSPRRASRLSNPSSQKARDFVRRIFGVDPLRRPES